MVRSSADPASNYFAVMLPAMLAGGIGTGLTFVGCTVTGMRGVAPDDTGIAAGLLNTSVQTGAALGLAALAAIASIVTRTHLPGHTTAVALTDGYVAGLLAGAITFAAGALVALLTIKRPHQPCRRRRPPSRRRQSQALKHHREEPEHRQRDSEWQPDESRPPPLACEWSRHAQYRHSSRQLQPGRTVWTLGRCSTTAPANREDSAR
jgi:hypothetical protein